MAGVALVGALCLATGAVIGTASGGPAGEVTIHVPGALNVSAYCGGNKTHFADGEAVTFLPEGTMCDLEAPLSQVMPLRGQIELSRATSYRCERRAMDLICEPSR